MHFVMLEIRIFLKLNRFMSLKHNILENGVENAIPIKNKH